ncbi:MAG: sigma-54 dependent transcriptional regulator [Bacteroidota bacterium]
MSDTGKFLVFVVDDDDWYRELLKFNLEDNPDYTVQAYPDATSCLEALHERPQVITLDYRLPDMEGSEALQKIKAFDPDIDVIVVSEQDSVQTAVELLKLGAYDYIAKSNDIRDRLLNTVKNIRSKASLETRIKSLQQEVEQKYDFQNSIIGQSPAIKRVFALIEKAIKTNITVTITGETGTGKELVAKAIHFNSKRKSQPMVPVNMAAIPKDLMESELFGHEKGAFTGAVNRRIGKFEEAHGGTLFLDEIGEMDVTFQAKLLRALQEREIIRIGSNSIHKIDTRIVVATNRNLVEEVKEGNFREDLFYRLRGLPIELPPLRERGNDILLLARYFLDMFCKENDLNPFSLNQEAQKKLLAYAYPGNIRELKSVIELAAVMANGEEITAEEITFSSYDPLPDALTEELTLKEYNHRILDIYLKRYEGDKKLVSEKLDIGLATVYRMLKEREEEA